MHHRRLDWFQPAVAFLLTLALSGCFRSASSGPNPLPSVPPSTSTLALAPAAFVTKTLPVKTSSTTAAPPQPVESPAETEPPQAGAVTVAATADACGDALPTRLQVDGYAYVDPDPPLPNNLRSEAGKDNELIGEIQAGQAMQILAGPECVDGSVWWQVRALETELVGWTVEGDGQDYWLIPCASEAECGEG
ncbi:MAG: SH3 domain-containing protein [Chloroflexi bacterium]|nr:MAG: SH3 domain-containing protein [Chloroflexota bacterium]